MKATKTILVTSLFVSSINSATAQIDQRIPYYGTGNDGDNTSGLLLINNETVSKPYLSYNYEPRIPYYGTGNDGDNTSGLLLINNETVSKSYRSYTYEQRIPYYRAGNDGDNTTGLLLNID